MGTDSLVFLEALEWFDQTGRELGQRLPEGGSGEIKLGAQLTVRENQAVVMFCQGKACVKYWQENLPNSVFFNQRGEHRG